MVYNTSSLVVQFVDNTKKHALSENRKGIVYVRALTARMSQSSWMAAKSKFTWSSRVSSELYWVWIFYGERDTTVTTRTSMPQTIGSCVDYVTLDDIFGNKDICLN